MIDHHKLLIQGLAGPHAHQLHTDAEFSAAIKSLAAMLPAMIDGLAARCTEQQATRAELMKAIMSDPFPCVWG